MGIQQLPPEQDLKALIHTEHLNAELERLRAGYDGCGCSDCQEFYKTLDLKKYGKRVIHKDEHIIIVEGKAGADLWDKYHLPDCWIKNDQVFITGRHSYYVTPNGGVVVDPLDGCGETQETPLPSAPVTQESVSKILDKEILPVAGIQAQVIGIMKQRGRPRKTGEISRSTAWRREKEKQGVLL